MNCHPEASEKKTVLYTTIACPYAHRAMLAAELRPPATPLKYEYVVTTNQFGVMDQLGVESGDFMGMFAGCSLAELRDHKERYKQLVNPTGEVPTLELPGGDCVYESEIIAEYLDQVCPQASTPLVPRDPLLAARMRLVMKHFNTVPPAMVALLKNQSPEQDAPLEARLDAALRKFTAALMGGSGFCLGGEDATLADVHTAPFLWRFGIVLKHYRGYSLLERHPRLAAVLHAVEGLAGWACSLGVGTASEAAHKPTCAPASSERLIALYALYANNGLWAAGPQLAGRGRSCPP